MSNKRVIVNLHYLFPFTQKISSDKSFQGPTYYIYDFMSIQFTRLQNHTFFLMKSLAKTKLINEPTNEFNHSSKLSKVEKNNRRAIAV